jgi:hypothetical protein
MSVWTCLTGLFPTFDRIGIWAPIALVLLRLLQGLGAGAEYGGAALMLAEQNPHRRGFYGAFAASGVFVGIAPRHGVPISPKTSPKAGEPGTASEATRNALAGAGQCSRLNADQTRAHGKVPTSVPSPQPLRVLWDGSAGSMRYVHST